MSTSLLIVGQNERAEARPIAEWMRAKLTPATTREFLDLSTALREIAADSWIPDLVVVIQSWPDEFSPGEVDRLLAFAPLARIVVCYGDWCESDGRNRSVWPLAARIPLRSAKQRIEREWQLLHNEPGVEPLPLSASRDEIFAADHPQMRRSMNCGSVMVDSPDVAYRQYLVQLLSRAGYTCEIGIPANFASSASVILFDADPWNDRRQVELGQLREQNPCARIVASQSLPYTKDEAMLRLSGATAMLPKLDDQQRLLDAVQSATGNAAACPSVVSANQPSCDRE